VLSIARYCGGRRLPLGATEGHKALWKREERQLLCGIPLIRRHREGPQNSSTWMYVLGGSAGRPEVFIW